METIEELRAAIDEVVKACPPNRNPIPQYLGVDYGMPSGYVFLSDSYVQIKPVEGGKFELWRGIYDLGVNLNVETYGDLSTATAAAIDFIRSYYKTDEEVIETRGGSITVRSRILVGAVGITAATLEGDGSQESTGFIRECLAGINYVVDDNGTMIMHGVEYGRLLLKLKGSK